MGSSPCSPGHHRLAGGIYSGGHRQVSSWTSDLVDGESYPQFLCGQDGLLPSLVVTPPGVENPEFVPCQVSMRRRRTQAACPVPPVGEVTHRVEMGRDLVFWESRGFQPLIVRGPCPCDVSTRGKDPTQDIPGHLVASSHVDTNAFMSIRNML